jgi:hypothetical protein
MTKAFTAMLDDVLPELNGCSPEMATNALRNACIELYKKSWTKVTELTAITVVPGTSSYTLTAPANTQIIGIKEAYIGSKKLTPIAATETTSADHYWVTDSGDVSGYFFEAGNTIHLYRNPATADTLHVIVALAPTTTATDIDQHIYDLYSEGICAGAKARLMSIPHKPYSDAGTAITYRALFAEAVRDAKWRAYKASTSSQIRTKFRTRT